MTVDISQVQAALTAAGEALTAANVAYQDHQAKAATLATAQQADQQASAVLVSAVQTLSQKLKDLVAIETQLFVPPGQTMPAAPPSPAA